MEQVTQDMQKFIVPQTVYNIEQFVNGKFVQDATDYTIKIIYKTLEEKVGWLLHLHSIGSNIPYSNLASELNNDGY